MTECEYCHRSGHVWFQCPKKPDGWKPERLSKTVRISHQEESETSPTTAKSDIPVSPPQHVEVHTQSKPKRKDTRKGDRHSPGYMAKYMREYRARQKEIKS